MQLERLSKFLSRSGIASRRKSDEIISSGRVKVNDVVVRDPFCRVTPSTDVITLDGERISLQLSYIYIALNKPTGYLSDLSDPRGRKVARDLIDVDVRLYPVGRLDYDSEGLMIFTNDGEFANSVMHPRYGVEKEYLVKLAGRLSASEQRQMVLGVTVAGETLKVTSVTELKQNVASTWYRTTLAEGKNRMIRRLAEALNHRVVRLKRIRIDGVTLGDLRPGVYRHIRTEEIRKLIGVSQ
jgi:23S rRNA pseudouridine2605 synthase